MMKEMIVALVVAAMIGAAEGHKAKIEDYTHVCQKCGKTTHYPVSKSLEPRTTVEKLRKGRNRELEASALSWYPRLCDDIAAALGNGVPEE